MPTLRRYRRVLLGFIGMALAAGAMAGLCLSGAFGGPDTRAVLPTALLNVAIASVTRSRSISPAYLRARVLVPNVTVAFTDSGPSGPVNLYIAEPGARSAVLLTNRKRMRRLGEVLADLTFSPYGHLIAFTARANTGRGNEPRTLWVLDLTRRTAKALSASNWDATPACWLRCTTPAAARSCACSTLSQARPGSSRTRTMTTLRRGVCLRMPARSCTPPT